MGSDMFATIRKPQSDIFYWVYVVRWILPFVNKAKLKFDQDLKLVDWLKALIKVKRLNTLSTLCLWQCLF